MAAFDLRHAILVLSRTPGVLDRWLRNLPDPWIQDDEGPDSRSPYDIVGHLLHGERTDWIPRLEQVLGGGGEEPFDPFDSELPEEDQERPLKELLEEFARIRRQNLAALRELRLTEDDLERTADHPELGAVKVRQLLSTWVAHDLSHIAQIAGVMARRYSDDVGPWKDYLPILDR